MPIYTRIGDDGTTSLFGGKRVPKSSPLVDLYGSIDELNSWLGIFDDPRLAEIQKDLLTIGSILSGGKGDIHVIKPRVRQMEIWIDERNKKLPVLRSFILPKGNMHIARAVCRRVERLAVKNHVDPLIIMYLNRLSDLLFVLARYINKQENVEEILWK